MRTKQFFIHGDFTSLKLKARHKRSMYYITFFEEHITNSKGDIRVNRVVKINICVTNTNLAGLKNT